jgi:hypothetical protein
MNLTLYLCLVVLLGIVVSVRVGRAVNPETLFGALLAFGALSLGLGIFLAVPVLQLTSMACGVLGLGEKSCLPTNDQTVWFLAAPMVVFPLYMLVMFGARASRRAVPAAAIPAQLFGATVASALQRFRTGEPVVDRCPACQGLLEVRASHPKPGVDGTRLAVRCGCGQCNGQFTVRPEGAAAAKGDVPH